MQVELSERQETTVSAAITIVAALVIVIAVGGIFWLVGAFFSRFANVLMPLVVAGVVALVLWPYYEWLKKKLRYQWLAIVVVFLSVILPPLAFLWIFGALVTDQVRDLITRGPEFREQATGYFQAQWPEVQRFLAEDPWGQKIQAAVEENTDELVAGARVIGLGIFTAGAGLLGWILGLFGWVVAPVYFIFFLMMDPARMPQLDNLLPFLKPETRKDVVFLAHEFVAIVVSFFRGQLVIAMIGGVMYAIAFTVVGLKYGFVLGLALGFLNLVPYLGSMIGLAIGIPTAFLQTGGGLKLALLFVLGFTVVQMIEGYFLVPKIMGDRTGLHPMVIMVAMFFWGSALGGIFGMVLAIPLTAFLVVLWRLAKERYMHPVV